MDDAVGRGASVAPLSADDIKHEVWREVARAHPAAAAEHEPRPHDAATIVATEQPVALTLPALLALDGPTFVAAAYRTILGRDADEAGVAYLTPQLSAGVSKIVLLGQLQRSVEGRQSGRTLPGLGRRYAAHRLYRVPGLGWGVRLVAAVLRRTGVSRALATPGLASALDMQRLARQDAAIAALTRANQVMQHQIADQGAGASQGLQALQRRVADELAAAAAAAAAVQDAMERRFRVQTTSLARRLDVHEDATIDSMLALGDTLADQTTRLVRLEALLNQEAVEAQIDAGAAALRQALAERLSEAEAVVAENRRDVIDQERRIGLILEAVRSRAEAMPAALDAEDERAVASLYVDFEDRFRGSRADIKQRQRFYLPILAESQAGAPTRPVVDVGCGRGEFLELLRDEGLTARGVDTNVAMAAACRERGLDCAAEDALTYLSRQAAGSLGAVTGFHIIEHLPFKTMVRLFDACLHALAPGGVMVFETPNPANLLVASRWFYLDPTHRNPLPGEMVAMIAEARGFCRISIVDLHPMAQRFGGNDPVLREQLDRLFHGPQDYALLARKP